MSNSQYRAQRRDLESFDIRYSTLAILFRPRPMSEIGVDIGVFRVQHACFGSKRHLGAARKHKAVGV